MQALSSRVDPTRFLQNVARAPARVLMLDYDGTLAPFNVRPDRAVPYPEVTEVLEHILASGATRVVIVSGRPAHEVPPLLALSVRPEIWGSHGWERLSADGRRTVEQPAERAQTALHEAAERVAGLLEKGARLERKLASVALHWRGLPTTVIEDLQGRARSAWEACTADGALELLPFDGGLELRVVGCNKQYAVKAVLAETPPESAVAYLGDDITDEDAFRAVKPRGLGVLVRDECRQTEADVWLKPPHELIEFLRHWAPGGHGR